MGSDEQRGIWRDWCGGRIWRGSRAKTGSDMDAGQVGSTGGLGVSLEPRVPMHLSLLLPSGGSMWLPFLTSVACTTQLPAMKSWLWPETWNCLRGEPCPLLVTVPSSQTSPCPTHLSASASLSSWATSPSPGWPGPVWPICPGFGLCLHPGLGPDAETLPALRLRAPHLCC